MKKWTILLLTLLILLSITGCRGQDEQFLYFYPRAEYTFGAPDAVIVSESREAPGHEDDLEYLLTMYLEGPLDASLVSPFPQGTSLEGFTYSDSTLYVTLNGVYARLDGMEHTIASACIAYTCFDLTAADTVVIKCSSEIYGNKSVTLRRDSLLLTDDSTAPPETEPS